MIGPKPLRIRFDKIDGFIRVFRGTWYLALFGPQKYAAIYNRFGYLINQKSNITYVFPNNCARIKVDFHDPLPIEKMLTLRNAMILISS